MAEWKKKNVYIFYYKAFTSFFKTFRSLFKASVSPPGYKQVSKSEGFTPNSSKVGTVYFSSESFSTVLYKSTDKKYFKNKLIKQSNIFHLKILI